MVQTIQSQQCYCHCDCLKDRALYIATRLEVAENYRAFNSCISRIKCHCIVYKNDIEKEQEWKTQKLPGLRPEECL
jgi:hypothetical protein